MKYSYLFTLTILLQGLCLPAQIIITPLHSNLDVFLLDQSLEVNLLNPTSRELSGRLEMSIETTHHQPIIKVSSLPMALAAGSSLSAAQIPWQASRLDLGHNQIAALLRQSKQLPSGAYIFCYRFIENTSNSVLGLHCQESNTSFFQPPELLSPYHGETIDIPFPVLSWQPPLPLSLGHISYDLKVVEQMSHQSIRQAMASNPAVLFRKGLVQPFLVYPSDALALEEGKSYIWQATAYYQNREIGQTSVWVFHYKPPLENAVAPTTEASYRFVKNQSDGTHYLSDNTLRLAFDNRHYHNSLSYQIVAVNDNKRAINSLPEIALKPGLNKLDIPIENLGLLDGERYLLSIEEDNETKVLEFIYSLSQQ